MNLKQCPKCKRYSVSFDFNRGVEVCHWRDCNWVNIDHKDLPVAHVTIITLEKNQAAKNARLDQQVSV